MTAALRGLLCAGLLLAGCGGVRLPAPEPHEVIPEKGYTGDVIEVEIRGDGFYPQVEADAARPGQAHLDQEFTVTLVGDEAEAELDRVTLVDFTTLTGEVPPGLPTGAYDLVVVGPTGARGELPDAYTVTPTRADELVVVAEVDDLTVNDTATVDIQLVDTDGNALREDLDVRVAVTGAELAPGDVEFTGQGLEAQVEDGPLIIGSLGPDGRARVFLEVSRPQVTTVTASPLDESTGVSPGRVDLNWGTGSDLRLEFELPEFPFAVEAGTPFNLVVRLVDENGYEVTDELVPVLMADRCGSAVIEAEITGTQAFPVSLTTECVDNAFYLFWGLGMVAEDTPDSAPFDVLPGPVDYLSLDLAARTVEAGEPLRVKVTAHDVYGNESPFTEHQLELHDSVHGFDPCLECCDFWETFATCTVEPEVAAEGVVLTASTPDEARGDSAAYTVLPADPADALVSPGAVPWVAGDDQAAAVTVFDRFANLVPAAGLEPETWTLTDPAGDIDCTWDGGGPTVASFTCVAYDAEVQPLEVHLPDWDLRASTPSEFEVVNGALHTVDVSASPSSVVVEDIVTLDLEGYDEWGNPYLDQPDSKVDLADTTGTISPIAARFGSDGTASVPVYFTAAGTTVVTVSQSSKDLGSSGPIEVLAGEAIELEVAPNGGWAWVDARFKVGVTAVDAWGNTADVDDTATLSTASGLVDDQDVGLIAGVGSAALTWDEPAFGEVLTAETDTLSGTSASFVVVEDCGLAGPTIDLAFGGSDHAVVCYDASTGTGTISASLAGSAAGSASLARYGLQVEDSWDLSTSAGVSLGVDATGVYTVRALVADDDGCGDASGSTAWVGPDDGQPVGPLTLYTADAEVEIGASGASTTILYVDAAADCAGDPASGGAVYLRTDRGVLSGPLTSDQGLYLTLDSAGDASATLDVASASTGGTGTVFAWVDSGTALGQTNLDVVGDTLRPVVWEQTPAGDELDLVDEIVLLFSEDLLADTMSESLFTVEESGGTSVDVDSVSLDGDEVTLTLDESADGSLGTWTVTADQYVRDEVGLRLDGAWTGLPGDYTGTFGDLPSGVDAVATCGVTPATFRPDGDPALTGAAEEADEVTLTGETTTTPSVWIYSVWDSSGALVRRERGAATSNSASWAWDGRDVDEQVVDNGIFVLEVDTGDGSGNRGGGCTAQVTVDNRGGG